MEYFDFNATTPMCEPAIEKWLDIAKNFPGNPSSLHRIGRRADHILDESRMLLSDIINCHSDDIVFTSGATESNNMVFHHLSSTCPPQSEVWISAIEHPCVRNAANHYFGKNVKIIEVTPDGYVEPNNLSKMIENSETHPVCISIMAANNETGALQNWEQLRAICESHKILFHCDAAQWLGKMPSQNIGKCDFVSGASHKFSGPKGVGFLKLPTSSGVQSLIHGGGQEEGKRAGTENVSGIASMMAALQYRNNSLDDSFLSTRRQWKFDFLQNLKSSIPGIKILGLPDHTLWNTIMVLMPETDCRQRWVVKLDKAGMAVSSGSACSSGEEKPSFVLTAMGLSPKQSGMALRLSGGWETQPRDWQKLHDALVSVYRDLTS